MAKSTELDFDNLFESFALGIQDKLVSERTTEINIIEFVEQEIDLGEDFKLTLQQRAILKSYYGLQLTEEEQSVLEFWKLKGNCSWDEGDQYQSLVICAGRRSSKTTLASIIAAYEYFCLCRMQSPQEYYGIARSTPISILVLATTAAQGKKTIFKAVTGVIRNTKYFQRLEEQGKIFIGKEEVSYEEKLLYVYSGNSQSGGQVGGTVKVLIMDEVARFKDVDGESNALELWSNLGISTTTFGKDAKRVAISSAWYEGDAIEKLFEGSKTDSSALGIHACSWDINPVHAARDNPIIASEYLRDPVQAALEFEGIRPSAVNAFLSAAEVKAAFRSRSVLKAERYEEEDSGFNLVKLRLHSIAPFNGSTVMHIDPAVETDAYAMAFGHNEFDSKGNQVVTIDGLLAWEPNHKAQVSITNVQDIILQIHKVRPISKLGADHYNSVETVQRLRRFGIQSEIEYFSNSSQVAMYDLVRMLLHEKRLVIPYDSPWTPLALSELCKVKLIKGRKIDHESNSSKDLADCIAAVCWKLATRITRDQVTGSTGSIKQISTNSARNLRGNTFKALSARDKWYGMKRK